MPPGIRCNIYSLGVFMHKYIIEGGEELSGVIHVSGSKNAALPVIFATIITEGVSAIYGLPDILDVRIALELLRGFGARITHECNVTYIDTKRLYYVAPDPRLVGRLRASTYLIGACLARFGVAVVGGFGGCSFSDRPIDLHLYAMRSLGAYDLGDRLLADKLSSAQIDFPIVSVGATVNALIAAARAEGESIISGASREPHIDTLIEFLRGAGAEINVEGSTIRIRGTRPGGSTVHIPGDMIEAGTYLTIGALLGGRVGVEGISAIELHSFLSPLTEAGMRLETKEGALYLLGKCDVPVSITTAPYPGFPTDLQPIAALLLAAFSGGTIKESVWRDRFGYLKELNKMGLSYKLLPSAAEIYKSELSSAVVTSPDLRGGAALVIAALLARGKSVILNAEMLCRGYERLEDKLLSLGARVKFIETT